MICFLHAASAEMTDGIVEMQDKLITSIHNKARKRHEDLLRATEEARSRAVEVLEEMGTVVLNDSIPDHEVRQYIFKLLPIDDASRLVKGCRNLRAGGDGSPLALIHHWYGYTRKYSPALLEKTIGDLDRAARSYGDRGYRTDGRADRSPYATAAVFRYVHFEAGAIGHRLYLAAEALGLGATGIGAFYDDEVHRHLNLVLNQGQVVYHFAIGHPVPDPRLSVFNEPQEITW